MKMQTLDTHAALMIGYPIVGCVVVTVVSVISDEQVHSKESPDKEASKIWMRINSEDCRVTTRLSSSCSSIIFACRNSNESF